MDSITALNRLAALAPHGNIFVSQTVFRKNGKFAEEYVVEIDGKRFAGTLESAMRWAERFIQEGEKVWREYLTH